jgi:hypothetical protein
MYQKIRPGLGFEREPKLALLGWVMILMTFGFLYLQTIDAREFLDVNIWVKPAKFAFSIGIYALTLTMFFGYVRLGRRKSFLMQGIVWTVILTSIFELSYIAYKASMQQASHFNFSDSFHIVLYALMGVAAVMLVSVMLPLAWEIARRPLDGLSNDYRACVVIGLVLSFILTLFVAGYLSSQGQYHIGALGGHFPITGWNRLGGDLRVSHFFALHLCQIIPFSMAIISPLPRLARWVTLCVVTLSSVILCIYTFVQALSGTPFLSIVS